MRAIHPLLICALLATGPAVADGQRETLPVPAIDEPVATAPARETAVFAGGCFWGVEAVFQHVQGVLSTEAGYAGGDAATAHYSDVSTGTTGHAEAVRITYDPHRITYGRLLRIFFTVALDPTEVDRQGPDEGPQYRSVIFAVDPGQRRVAEAYLTRLADAHVWSAPIATRVMPLPAFYPAESWHQDYVERHPRAPYVVINDLPKLDHLRREFPADYRRNG